MDEIDQNDNGMEIDSENKVDNQKKEALNLKTPIWQVKSHENWVKTVLISDIVESGGSICEFCCGTGLELGKWIRAKISNYVGVDGSVDNLKEAQKRLQEKQQLDKTSLFKAQFKEHDLFNNPIDKVVEGEFDVVCCFDGLQKSFEDKEKASMFLKNVASKLKSGGFFFGIVPDSSAIWYKATKSTSGNISDSLGNVQIKGDLYSMVFPSDNFTYFGSRYTFKTDTETTNEYLVHFPSLLKLANLHGLNMLEIANLLEFYEDNRKNHFDHLKNLKVMNSQGKFEPQQKELIGLYATFVFQKVDNNS